MREGGRTRDRATSGAAGVTRGAVGERTIVRGGIVARGIRRVEEVEAGFRHRLFVGAPGRGLREEARRGGEAGTDGVAVARERRERRSRESGRRGNVVRETRVPDRVVVRREPARRDQRPRDVRRGVGAHDLPVAVVLEPDPYDVLIGGRRHGSLPARDGRRGPELRIPRPRREQHEKQSAESTREHDPVLLRARGPSMRRLHESFRRCRAARPCGRAPSARGAPCRAAGARGGRDTPAP